MVSLIFLVAFESLAVTTVMATVTGELDARSWFSVAFSATLAASVVGMVLGGWAADRRGPGGTLLVSVGVFVAGLVLAGLAPGIEVFVTGRFLQGLGTGAVNVALYVLVADVFDAVDRPRIFGAFAAAWVLPSMVGPPVAGVVADTVGWRWVFLGVVVLAGAATAALSPALASTRRDTTGARSPGAAPVEPARGPGGVRRRVLLAATVAAAVVVVDLSGQAPPRWSAVLAAAGVLAVGLAVRPLLPGGTLRARPGLPAVVLLRGLAAAAFFATEVHVPYLLQARYGAPSWLAGLALTVGALGWAGASQVQARLGPRLADRTAMVAGAGLLLGGLGAQLVVVALALPPWLVPLAWVCAGAGMGSMYPRISSAVLAASAPGEAGTHSAAMTIGDAVGGATAIAVAGLVLTGVGALSGAESQAAFAAVSVLTTALAVLTVLTARRTRPA